MTMRTLVYQVASSVQIAALGTQALETPVIRPSIDDRIALQGQAFEAITVDRPEVTFSVIPFTALATLDVTLGTTRYSVQGGQGRDLTAANPSGTVNVTGIFVQNRGIITHDCEFEGIFQDTLTITNVTAAPIILFYITSVYTKLNNENNDAGDDLMRKKEGGPLC